MSAEKPRLFLILPPLADAAFAPTLTAALDAAEIACVLARVAAGDGAQLPALAIATQTRGAAFLVAEDIDLAQTGGTDGVHVAGVTAAVAAAKRLKPALIVGVGGLRDRDSAMTAGEADVDYVMFGEPEAGLAGAALAERVAWWAELFTVPCVACATTLADIAPLAAAGADFIALGDAVWSHPHGAAAALAEAQAALALPEAAL